MLLLVLSKLYSRSSDETAQSHDVMQVLGKEAACQLWGLLGDPWLPDSGLHTTTQLQPTHDSQVLVEIGPRYVPFSNYIEITLSFPFPTMRRDIHISRFAIGIAQAQYLQEFILLKCMFS